jgi:hypothetical protein
VIRTGETIHLENAVSVSSDPLAPITRDEIGALLGGDRRALADIAHLELWGGSAEPAEQDSTQIEAVIDGAANA